jgi:hypothetical protein
MVDRNDAQHANQIWGSSAVHTHIHLSRPCSGRPGWLVWASIHQGAAVRQEGNEQRPISSAESFRCSDRRTEYVKNVSLCLRIITTYFQHPFVHMAPRLLSGRSPWIVLIVILGPPELSIISIGEQFLKVLSLLNFMITGT